ncbi:hypothetical protein ACH4D5_34085 [Streptomyces sp. NPDC018029]|uniref:hypothetical protein n=1 Tax=Streptomyces sp. NPDC018029 TaxID=3365032 RepID=UPI0037974B51
MADSPGPVVCPARGQLFPAAVSASQSAASASVIISRACVGCAVPGLGGVLGRLRPWQRAGDGVANTSGQGHWS